MIMEFCSRLSERMKFLHVTFLALYDVLNNPKYDIDWDKVFKFSIEVRWSIF